MGRAAAATAAWGNEPVTLRQMRQARIQAMGRLTCVAVLSTTPASLPSHLQ